LKELIPDLFDEIDAEMVNMNHALRNDDFDTLIRLGHGFKGAAATYGLDDLSSIFLEIGIAAKNRDKDKIMGEMANAMDHLANLEIEYSTR